MKDTSLDHFFCLVIVFQLVTKMTMAYQESLLSRYKLHYESFMPFVKLSLGNCLLDISNYI